MSNPHAETILQDRIGPYALIREIGRGALSTVYMAESARDGVCVALKLLDLACDGERLDLARLAREREALERIEHENVAELLDAGTAEDGRPYLVFELIEGPTLKARIEAGERPDMIRIMDWMIQAASALEEAWKRHIVHRDIKPGNLITDAEGRLKVLDFGLAKAIHEDSSITRSRQALGTPLYMSPEMALGQSLDLRADIYSLGATFYHLLTGQPAFVANSAVATMMRHANAPLVSPQSIDPTLPADLSEIIERMMAKAPGDRYQDYDELTGAVRAARLAEMARRGVLPGDLPDMAAAASPAAPFPPTSGESEETGPADRLRWLFTVTAIAGISLAIGLHLTFREASPERQPGVPAIWSELKGRTSGARSSLDIQNRERMVRVMAAVIGYEIRHSAQPGTLDHLVEESMLGPELLRDAWGGAFAYDAAGNALLSPGPDGRAGTEDDVRLLADMTFERAPSPDPPAGSN